MEYLAWPAVVLVLGLVALFMFKRNIAGRIDKIQKIERIGVSMGAEQTQAVSETKRSGFQELMDSTSSPLLRQQESKIRDDLNARGVTNEQEIIKVLTRAAAGLWLVIRWEQLDRIIFGSQLMMLIALNASALGLSVEQIGEFYKVAKNQFPAAYENYLFEQWLGFLVSQGLISKGGNGYQVTLDGKEFMSWLVQAGRTQPHPN
jgi:hypothetical protein